MIHYFHHLPVSVVSHTAQRPCRCQLEYFCWISQKNPQTKAVFLACILMSLSSYHLFSVDTLFCHWPGKNCEFKTKKIHFFDTHTASSCICRNEFEKQQQTLFAPFHVPQSVVVIWCICNNAADPFRWIACLHSLPIVAYTVNNSTQPGTHRQTHPNNGMNQKDCTKDRWREEPSNVRFATHPTPHSWCSPDEWLIVKTRKLDSLTLFEYKVCH